MRKPWKREREGGDSYKIFDDERDPTDLFNIELVCVRIDGRMKDGSVKHYLGTVSVGVVVRYHHLVVNKE